ncbi:MAG TPA: 1,4-dihydroxy-2-naphthoate octaprenyltransferase [Bacteroidales bacterium]|nr:1,4-dihydroxy-2-naphthoate octaprenyltransferase [Bacteroidales bacterium]
MASLSNWLKAARLRTLPLALASMGMGAFVASREPGFNPSAAFGAALTTVFLQVLSNFANDLGDAVKGTDNRQRVGPQRMVQSGAISRKAMKSAVAIMALASFMSGLWLLFGLSHLDHSSAFGMLLLGFAAIAAAIKYTVGSRPYGYRSLGDVFVFLFFGLTGVAGTYFLVLDGSFDAAILLPASAVGLLSTAVLNINNMRDMATDRFSGKRTLVVIMGYNNALLYHIFLVITPFILIALFNLVQGFNVFSWAYLLMLPLFLKDLRGVLNSPGYNDLDPYLRRQALNTFLLVVVYGLSIQF